MTDLYHWTVADQLRFSALDPEMQDFIRRWAFNEGEDTEGTREDIYMRGYEAGVKDGRAQKESEQEYP